MGFVSNFHWYVVRPCILAGVPAFAAYAVLSDRAPLNGGDIVAMVFVFLAVAGFMYIIAASGRQKGTEEAAAQKTDTVSEIPKAYQGPQYVQVKKPSQRRVQLRSMAEMTPRERYYASCEVARFAKTTTIATKLAVDEGSRADRYLSENSRLKGEINALKRELRKYRQDTESSSEKSASPSSTL